LTDPSGVLAASYAFSAWGEILDTSGAVSPLAWQGNWGYYQDNIERTWVRARHMDTRRGRWMSQDPLGFRNALNPYAYADNSPTTLVDPSGKVVWWVVAGVVIGLLAVSERGAGIPVRGYRPRPLIFEDPFNQTPIGRAFGAWRDIQGAITGCDPIDGARLSWPERIERILGLGLFRRRRLAPAGGPPAGPPVSFMLPERRPRPTPRIPGRAGRPVFRRMPGPDVRRARQIARDEGLTDREADEFHDIINLREGEKFDDAGMRQVARDIKARRIREQRSDEGFRRKRKDRPPRRGS
jgi:RHS repeat-associated protein